MIPPLRQQLKAGQRQVDCSSLAQIYRRDRDLLHVTPSTVKEALAVTYDQDYDEALAEPFVAVAGAWPSPAFPSVGDLIVKAAQRKGMQ